MRTPLALALAGSLLFGAGGALGGAPGAAADAPAVARIRLLDNDGLVNGSPVRLLGRGFVPGASVGVRQCVAGFEAQDACRRLGTATADAAGRVRTTVPVARNLGAPERMPDGTQQATVDCRVAPGCTLSTVGPAEAPGAGTAAGVALHFRAPTQPRRLVDPVFSSVARTANVVYGQADDAEDGWSDLLLDVYQPVGDTKRRRPAVVWFFGGGFVSGNKEQQRPFAEDSARRGYVGVAANYRITARRPIGQVILEAYVDATAAVNFLRANAASYGIDPDRIAVAGYSAGAITALNVAYGPDITAGAQPIVRAVGSIAGFSPFEPQAGEPPMIAFHGEADTVVPFALEAELCDRATAAGVACVLDRFPGIGHEVGVVQFARVTDRMHRQFRTWLAPR